MVNLALILGRNTLTIKPIVGMLCHMADGVGGVKICIYTSAGWVDLKENDVWTEFYQHQREQDFREVREHLQQTYGLALVIVLLLLSSAGAGVIFALWTG